MASSETEIGGGDRAFPSTSLSALGRTQDLIAQYWKPVYCVIRSSWAKSNEDAKDLTQEFFSRAVLEGDLARTFDPTRGSFRAFLKGALQNFMRNVARDASAQKRGGTVRTLRLDADDAELDGMVAAGAGADPGLLFDLTWREEVLGRAIRRLEERLAAAGKPECFRVFRRYELDAGSEAASYDAVGRELGMSANVVKHSLGLAREEFRHAVSEVLCGYAGSPEVLREELRDLFGP